MAIFEGYKKEIEQKIADISGKFYVYLLCKPNGTCFYVGKGIHRRIFDHEMEARQHHSVGETNPIKNNIIRKMDNIGQHILYRVDSVYSRENEKACLDREAQLIRKLKRLHEGGTLSNLAPGGGNSSGLAPHSIKAHAATLSGEPDNNPERATLNRYLQGIGPVKSVPVKPASQISWIRPTRPHTQPRRPTKRCAFALLASACAHGLRIEPMVEIPRSFSYENVEGVIENGVARDIIKAGMAELMEATEPKNEKFIINENQCNIIKKIIGDVELIKRGLI
ncbi:GIY-YIG nuclease family protein [Ferruginivarius sediminum]|uniref:GIY-YIG nuclease family protein n=1 Tax=Ferruginivarius sediminum TaxID=2661937 RepID=UPI0011C01F57|nr:GIY-YIG nuclease family protein [Ferruginivarius sediminum]